MGNAKKSFIEPINTSESFQRQIPVQRQFTVAIKMMHTI